MARREGAVLVAGDRRGTRVARPEQNGSFVVLAVDSLFARSRSRPGVRTVAMGVVTCESAQIAKAIAT